MQYGWIKLAEENQLSISIAGIPSLTTYSFNYEDSLKYKTLVTQEMLKKGFLASANFYASIAHENLHFDMYFNALNEVYRMVRQCEHKEKQIDELLEGPVCHAGFKRLN
jgi:hypothetical protein